jgi:hypothetical protein
MTQLAPREDWPDPPRAIAYFCGVLEHAHAGDPSAARERVRTEAIRFLNGEISKLWPRVEKAPGEFRWDVLVAPASQNGNSATATADSRRFDSQFWTANVNPSDRYVQSLAGTSRHRISPLEQQFDNLTIAGDWTKTNLNIGCVESAIMSGRLAAHALSAQPALADIVGFDHP